MNKILTRFMQKVNKHENETKQETEHETEHETEQKTKHKMKLKVKERIKKLLEQLNTGIYEKEDVMALALLSSIAGESIFLLGPPGVAKSLIARRLKYAYKDAKVFEYLMSRFSTPDEIFGPVSISELKKDKYVRIVKNYLPAADVVFLDEIWKAGPSIQNALLTILNEKKFRNGEEEIDVPMKALISASNELPEKDQGLEALWDRFLVRLVVEGIEDKAKFNEMIAMPSALFDEKIDVGITDNEYKEWSKIIDQIVITENVFTVIQIIKDKINLHNQNNMEDIKKQIYVSDRRWRKIIRLMRTSAFLNDRTEVDLMDIFLIKHCIWNEENQRDTVWQFLRDAIEEINCTIITNFKDLNDIFTGRQEEINIQTNKDIKVFAYDEIGNNELIRIINPPDSELGFIRCKSFKNLTNKNKSIYLVPSCTIFDDNGSFSHSYGNPSLYNIRKGNSYFSLFINDIEYNLRITKILLIIRKLEPDLEKKYDEYAEHDLLNFDNAKYILEQYQNINLEHFRTNLFVDLALADIVESKITATQKEIEKFELKVMEIQNNYKKIKNEDVEIKNARSW